MARPLEKANCSADETIGETVASYIRSWLDLRDPSSIVIAYS